MYWLRISVMVTALLLQAAKLAPGSSNSPNSAPSLASSSLARAPAAKAVKAAKGVAKASSRRPSRSVRTNRQPPQKQNALQLREAAILPSTMLTPALTPTRNHSAPETNPALVTSPVESNDTNSTSALPALTYAPPRPSPPAAPPAPAAPRNTPLAEMFPNLDDFVEGTIRDYVRADDEAMSSINANCRNHKTEDITCVYPDAGAMVSKSFQDAPVGTLHYNIRPNWKNRNQNCGRHLSICSFFRVADAFQRACNGDGCRVIYGDFFSPRSHKIHAGHGTGNCVDVLPFRHHETNDLKDLSVRSKNYNRERTRAFIALARAMGANEIIFGDPLAKPDKQDGDHIDHIHLCFPEDSPLAQASCEGDANALMEAFENSEKTARSDVVPFLRTTKKKVRIASSKPRSKIAATATRPRGSIGY